MQALLLSFSGVTLYWHPAGRTNTAPRLWGICVGRRVSLPIGVVMPSHIQWNAPGIGCSCLPEREINTRSKILEPWEFALIVVACCRCPHWERHSIDLRAHSAQMFAMRMQRVLGEIHRSVAFYKWQTNKHYMLPNRPSIGFSKLCKRRRYSSYTSPFEVLVR